MNASKILLVSFTLIVYTAFVIQIYDIDLNNSLNSIIISLHSINSTTPITTSTTKPVKNKSNKCNPINGTLYTVQIDNTTYPQYVPHYFNTTLNFACLNSSSKMKKILFWNDFFGDKTFRYGLGKVKPFQEQKCPVSNCELINNKSRLNEADLVLVHMRNSFDEIPTNQRPEHQRWVFFLYESPVHSGSFIKYNNLFNLTATYRLNSDFDNHYEEFSNFYWAENRLFDTDIDFTIGKTKLACALISHCSAHSQRDLYIKEMQSYAQVDVYGKCGRPCPSQKKDLWSGDCKEALSSEYKFFLAFENSFCLDYVTEKFFQILQFNIIPVVLGGGNYSFYIPKSGFINVLDFKSPKLLVKYLKYLAQNKTAYNEYFKWKRHVTFHKNHHVNKINSICGMCVRLHLEERFGLRRKVMSELGEYWNEQSVCKKAKYKKDQFFYY